MSLLEALLLGVVQGVFMFFPVSSTGHLVLTQHVLAGRGSTLPAPESAEMLLFDLLVHVGTVVSIAIVFRSGLQQLGRGVLGDLRERLGRVDGRATGGLYLRLGVLGAVSVAVTGGLGLLIRLFGTSAFEQTVWVAVALALTGVVLWWTDVIEPSGRDLRDLTVVIAIAIGAAQGLALLPGLSRSGWTIAIALFLGLQRRRAAQYSFYLAIPTIVAAAAVQGWTVLTADEPLTIGGGAYVAGAVAAAVVGVIALKLVLAVLYRARFRYFSFYLWALAALVLFAEVPGF
jgi:undecaprenyl-diphosphatase